MEYQTAEDLSLDNFIKGRESQTCMVASLIVRGSNAPYSHKIIQAFSIYVKKYREEMDLDYNSLVDQLDSNTYKLFLSLILEESSKKKFSQEKIYNTAKNIIYKFISDNNNFIEQFSLSFRDTISQKEITSMDGKILTL